MAAQNVPVPLDASMASAAADLDPEGRKRKEATEQSFVSKSHFSQMLEEHAERTRKMQVSMLSESDSNNTMLMQQFSSETDRRFLEHEQRISTVESRVDTVASEQARLPEEVQSMRSEQESLRTAMHLANRNALTREEVNSDDFDRPPCLDIIKVSTPKYVSQINIENAVAPWLGGCGIAQ